MPVFCTCISLLKVSARTSFTCESAQHLLSTGELNRVLVTLPVTSLGCRSEANDLALRLALHHTKNTEILTLDR